MGFTEVKAYISAELRLEGNPLPTADADAYLIQKLNQAVAIISTEVKPIAWPWTSAAAPTGFGTGTTANGITNITLPRNFSGPIRKVYYDLYDLQMVDQFYLEDASIGLPPATNTPSWCVEGRTFRITQCNLALLTVHAYKNLVFYDGTSVNPMADLPERFDLLAAYWVLARWPASVDSGVEQQRLAVNRDLFTTEMEALKREINSAQSEEWSW